MVYHKQQEACDQHKRRADSLQQHLAHGFLHRHHIKKPIDEFRRIGLLQRLGPDQGKPIHDVERCANEQSALDHIDDVPFQNSDNTQ